MSQSETYTARVNFRDEDITDEEYAAAISELGELDGVEVEERRQEARMVANSDVGASVALAAGTLAVTGIDTLVNIYKLARSNPAFFRMWTNDEDGHQIETWDEERLEMNALDEENETVLAKVKMDGDDNDVDLHFDGPVYFVDSNEASMFPDDSEED
jgi:hypothetical protein